MMESGISALSGTVNMKSQKRMCSDLGSGVIKFISDRIKVSFRRRVTSYFSVKNLWSGK